LPAFGADIERYPGKSCLPLGLLVEVGDCHPSIGNGCIMLALPGNNSYRQPKRASLLELYHAKVVKTVPACSSVRIAITTTCYPGLTEYWTIYGAPGIPDNPRGPMRSSIGAGLLTATQALQEFIFTVRKPASEVKCLLELAYHVLRTFKMGGGGGIN
jgi:hypothetical protein